MNLIYGDQPIKGEDPIRGGKSSAFLLHAEGGAPAPPRHDFFTLLGIGEGPFKLIESIFYENEDDLDTITDSITSYICFCEENIVQTKRIKVYANSKPWANRELKTIQGCKWSQKKKRKSTTRQ